MISAAASQRRMAASPRVRCPLPGSASAEGTFPKTAAPAVTAAPAITLFFKNERRSRDFFAGAVTASPVVGFEFEDR